jgi:hypothetical protein
MTPPDTPSDRSTPPPQPAYHSKSAKVRHTADGRVASYRRLEPLAVWSLTLGGLSFLPLFGWPMIVLPVGGAICGLLALRQIKNLPGERTGHKFAVAGLALSIGLGLLGVVGYAFFVVHGAPIGYTSVTFNEMQPNRDKGEVVPQKIEDLKSKFIFVKGYMYPGRRSMGIKEFVLVPTQSHCKFCQRDLASTEMIKVVMVGDQLADYSTNLVGVGGKLDIDNNEALRPLGGMPYKIEADVFRE